MDDRIRDAIADKGLAKSQIIVLDALLKLRQICCHPQLLKLPAAQKVKHSAKLDFLTDELLPTLLVEAADEGIVDALEDGSVLFELLRSENERDIFNVAIK